MHLCCSHYGWCGTDELHCGNPDPNSLAPYQAIFGLYQIIPPPSCAADANSTNGRSIRYYQASNTRDRLCSRISPSQIITTCLSHLYFAFAKIEPRSFVIAPDNNGDTALYHEFTKLQSPSSETWIAVGGFDFSHPGPTRTTWSDLTSNQAISQLQPLLHYYSPTGEP